MQNRKTILEKIRNDKMECPLCKLNYGRVYLHKHLEKRHNIDDGKQYCKMIKESRPTAMVEVQ